MNEIFQLLCLLCKAYKLHHRAKLHPKLSLPSYHWLNCVPKNIVTKNISRVHQTSSLDLLENLTEKVKKRLSKD